MTTRSDVEENAASLPPLTRSASNGSIGGAGRPSMRVDSGEKVANFNADKVDGLDSGELRGQQGPPGPRGPQGEPGEPGSALAYAHIRADGTFDPVRSKNVRASFKRATGQYCIDFTVREPLNVVATIDALSVPR